MTTFSSDPPPVAGDPACRDTQTPFTVIDREAVDQVEELSLGALLAVILSPLPGSTCRDLLDAHGGQLRSLDRTAVAELRAVGFTPRAIVKLRAIMEVAKRYGQEEFVPGEPFRGSHAVYAHFREHLAAEVVEHFYVVLLDNKNRKLRDVLVSKGSLTSSIIHPRDVYAQVIRDSAAGVVFVHNHPSGDPTPSREDIEITRRLREVGELIGVRVLDHIVIGRGRYVSFVDDGYW